MRNLLRNDQNEALLALINKKLTLRLPVYFLVIVLMSNLNAFVDFFQHPEIPYFDTEHIVVGSISVVIVLILLVIFELYLHGLSKDMIKLKTLEGFLSICANCKRIRIPGSDPEDSASWLPIELYINKKTATVFSHGICPICEAKLYPE